MKRYPIVVIGAGAGGLVVAIGAAKAGKKILLIEKGHYGGDCTNFGCIPSKSLIAAAEKAQALQEGPEFGINFECKNFEAAKSLNRVRNIIHHIREHEEPPALNKLGVETLTGFASFDSPHELSVKLSTGDTVKIYADKIVIATGSHPLIPPMKGLKEAPYLTNETIFDLKDIPKRLGVIGAGPIGCELAQAFNRLGSEVTLFKSKRGILPKEDKEIRSVMEKQMQKENIRFFTSCETTYVLYKNGKFSLCAAEQETVEVDNLLVSTGRSPNIEGLNLDKAHVAHSEKGIPIDAYGRTNQHHIFAIGDVVGGLLFTHLAENHGRAVLTTLLLPGCFKKRLDLKQSVPRCTFTFPEVASVGLNEDQAIEKYGKNKLAIYHIPFSEVDRAITTNETDSFVKIVTKKWSSKILGATVVCSRAGEMLPELSLAMLYNIPLRKLARLIHPYPTYNAAIRKAADQWLTNTILGALKGKK